MTPRIKADQLFSAFKPSVIDDDTHEQAWWKEFSKSRAIICVDEILNEVSGLPELKDGWSIGSIKEYWQQVKAEIEKL